MQNEDGYLNPIIYPGDRLISIDDWHLEHESIEMVKTALRGMVHSPAVLKLCRTVCRGARQRHAGLDDSEVVDFTYEVKLLRMLPPGTGTGTTLQESSVSSDFYGFHAVQRAVSWTLGADDLGTPRPEWTVSPVSQQRTIGTVPKARPPQVREASQSMADWLFEGGEKKAKRMMFTDLPGIATFRPSTATNIDVPEIRPSTPSASPISRVSRNDICGQGDVPLSQIIADIVDPDSPRACESADPWMLVA